MSDNDNKAVHLVVHGHFYQPPRENPWTDAVEREPGAEPYHDWNARIADECYRQNGRARIFNDRGQVKNIVNNYEHLSFNMGPTLLSWLEQHERDVYEQLRAADRNSRAQRGGHGNAIAQAYGHAILPLCNERDLLTQIRWGKRDFSYRFEREPEALWLPETAINTATSEALIAEGLSYVILAPGQARRVRPLGTEAWTDVSGARIDPRMPYRLYSERDRARHIDVFFYDGPVSHALGFEGLLGSSNAFVDKLWGAVDQARDRPQLVHTAVDGETFGHHHRHADRALAYALHRALGERGFTLTNYGQYLELHPPTHEVELEHGPDGEGTAWSCAHGVGRWTRDCGCHAGSPEGWNQAWRTPLRNAVNALRDRAAEVFEEVGGRLFKDVWAARDDYVELLLDRSPEARQRFIERHGTPGAAGRSVRLLQLLEMQRHALLAQTSCGWFFDDISGLEAQQVLRYAARSVQLLKEVTEQNFEPRLLAILGEARSNKPAEGTGADVYRNRALAAVVDDRRIVAQEAIKGLYRDLPDQYRRYGFKLDRVHETQLSSGPLTVSAGRFLAESERTGDSSDLIYALMHFGSHDFHCAVRGYTGQQDFRTFNTELRSAFERATVTELLRTIDKHFGENYFGLPDMMMEDREQVLDSVFGDLHETFGQLYAQLYEMHRRTIGALMDYGLKMPREFRIAAEYTLARQLEAEIAAQSDSLDQAQYARAREIVAEANARGYRLDKSVSGAHFGEILDRLVGELVKELSAENAQEATRLLKLAEYLELELPLGRSQDMVFDLLRPGKVALKPADAAAVGRLLDKLQMDTALLHAL